MREREIRQGQVELTRNPIQSTLESGEIFMAEPGQGEGVPRLPQDENTVAGADLSRRDASTRAVISAGGLKEIHVPLAELTPERIEEIMHRFGELTMTPELKRAYEKLRASVGRSPRLFSKTISDAITELPVEGQRRLVEIAYDGLVSGIVSEAVSFPPESLNRLGLEDKVRRLSESEDPSEKLTGLKRIKNLIGSEKRLIARKELQEKWEDKISIPESALAPTRTVLRNLIASYVSRRVSPDSLSPGELQTLINIANGQTVSPTEQTLLARAGETRGETQSEDLSASPSVSLPTGEPLAEAVVDGVGSGGGRVPPIETATAAPGPEDPEEVIPVAPITPEVAETVEPVVASEPEVVPVIPGPEPAAVTQPAAAEAQPAQASPSPEAAAAQPAQSQPEKEDEEKPKYRRVEDAYYQVPDEIQEMINITIAHTCGENLPQEVMDQMRQKAAEAWINIKSKRKEGAQIGVPNNMEALAELIMKSSTAEWKRGGGKALISEDKEGNERVNVVNVLDWARNNMYRVHDANPTSPINFFSDIGTSVRNDMYGSQISFYEIVFTESIWLDKTPEDGNEAVKQKNKEYQALRNQMLMETFLFSAIRNPDVTWSVTRGSKDSMQKAIAEAMTANPLTRSNFFEFIFTMPSMHRKSISEMDAASGTEMQTKQEGNFFMGDAAREALAAYMNISNYEQLVKLLGPNAALFKINYEDWDITKGERHKDDAGNNKPDKKIAPDVSEYKPKDRESWFWTEERKIEEKTKVDGDGNLSDAEKEIRKGLIDGIVLGSVVLYKLNQSGRRRGDYEKVDIFLKDADGNYKRDAKGKLIKGKERVVDIENNYAQSKPDDGYMKYINVFLLPMPDQRQQGEVRTRIILSIKEKYGLSFREAQLAELWAFSMTHTNGVAADMDTDAVAFDYLTRFLRFREKRKRDRADKRTSGFGGKYNLEGLKRIGLPFFEAARDVRGRSIKSIIQGGTGKNMNIEQNPFKDKLDYERDQTGNIIFKRGDDVVTGIVARNYEIYDRKDIVDGETRTTPAVRFLDASGQEVQVGEAKPTKITIKAMKVEFNADLQKQFVPNHVFTGVKAYDWIMSEVGLRLPKLIEKYDDRGHPVIIQEELIKLKDGIAHDLRYFLSTWAEINYGEEIVRCEKVEVRDEKGRLVAKEKRKRLTGKKDDEGYDEYEEVDQYLDDEWHILDEKGRRTEVRGEPDTYLESKEMTILESMFGVDALRYIQFEIERQGLTATKKQKDKKTARLIPIREYGRKGKEELMLDLTNCNAESFKTAVWQGVLDYIIAAEIESHRDPGSGFERYNSGDMKRAADALIEGKIATADRTGYIRRETGTTAPWVYTEDISYAASIGGLEGLLKAIMLTASFSVK